MKKIFIIHGWGGSSKTDWVPWLAATLNEKGYQAVAPDMPDTENPAIEPWVQTLASAVGMPDQDTYFVGHSIGCQTILRYLEIIDAKVGGALFVAGWFDLENLEGPEEVAIAEPWINNPLDIEKIKSAMNKSILLISDNDPFGTFEENKQQFKQLGSEIIVLHNAGHISEGDGFNELPQAVDLIEKLASN